MSLKIKPLILSLVRFFKCYLKKVFIGNCRNRCLNKKELSCVLNGVDILKIIRYGILIILLLFINIATASAHSGRTDSNGGHRDVNNVSGLGSYHFHHGLGPHLHPNGICPYANNSSKTTEGSNIFYYVIGGTVVFFVLRKVTNHKKEMTPKNRKSQEIYFPQSDRKANVVPEKQKVETIEKTETDISIPTCPTCGSKMVLRKGKYGKFYGCSRYPRCRGTRNYK